MLKHFFILFLAIVPFYQSALAEDSSSLRSPLISGIDYFHESPDSLFSIHEAKAFFQHNDTQTADTSLLTFGISNQAVWVRLSLKNTSAQVLHQRLNAAKTWVESTDVYLVAENDVIQHWHSGDGERADAHLLPEIGIVFDVDIPPGDSEIYIRAQSADPLILPISLMSNDDARHSDVKDHLFSGILYGILLALVGYNFILYATLKQKDALYYSFYISCFIIMNFGYSGYAFSWLYPHSPLVQNYMTLIFMVLHGVSGLIFVSNFLELKQKMPKLEKGVRFFAITGIALISAFTLLQDHLSSSFVAFSFLTATTLIMVAIGILNLSRVKDAQYFLLAVCCSMFGLFVTTLSVWGFIPYTHYGYNSAAYGVLLEALILAVILANRLKTIERERIDAKYLSSYDPLTKLFNRHAFVQSGNKILQNQSQDGLPVSFLILDIDYFKSVNDTYGHHIGDKALCHVSNLIRSSIRESDIVARWGGEEMVVLLPDTELKAAVKRAEHIRTEIDNNPLVIDGKRVQLTASFGVAMQNNDNENLEALFKLADEQLYIAKSRGRNRVEPQFT